MAFTGALGCIELQIFPDYLDSISAARKYFYIFRPLLVESSVIVIFYVFFMRCVVIINYYGNVFSN